MIKPNLLACVAVLFVSPLLQVHAAPPQSAGALTPAKIEEAIRFGNSQKVLFAPVQIDCKWAAGGGAEIGFASTPFLRVARLAADAKQKYRQVAAADVSSEDLSPELHIYVGSRSVPGAKNSFERANVVAIVFTPRNGSDEEKRAKAVQPLRSSDLEERFQNLFGAEGRATGMVAAFPIDILNQDLELHVVFDKSVQVAGVVSCSDCKVKVDAKKLKL